MVRPAASAFSAFTLSARLKINSYRSDKGGHFFSLTVTAVAAKSPSGFHFSLTDVRRKLLTGPAPEATLSVAVSGSARPRCLLSHGKV